MPNHQPFEAHNITPLIIQHAADAPFYWSQRGHMTYSPVLGLEKLAHFDNMLSAHLDGLTEAGEDAWPKVLKNLRRWPRNGESFTAWVLALQSGNAAYVNELWPFLKSHPDTTMRGLISALAWMEQDQALPWLETWLASNAHPELQLIALRSYSLHRITPAMEIAPFFNSDHASLRAAACTLAGYLRHRASTPYLQALCKDEEPEVRQAAALALYLLGDEASKQTVASQLWQALLLRTQDAAHKKALAHQLAWEKCVHLARHFGHALAIGQIDWQQVAPLLPPRLLLTILAHHGDPATVPLLLAYVDQAEHARLAAWAIGLITGIDIAASGLSQAAPEEKEEKDPHKVPVSDPDFQLPWPNPSKLRAWWQAVQTRMLGKGKLLLGQSAEDEEHCLAVLAHGNQTARFAAAVQFALAHPGNPFMETRAPASRQRIWLATFG